jgi:hypothetical protein
MDRRFFFTRVMAVLPMLCFQNKPVNAQVSAQVPVNRDGEWWNTLGESVKSGFIVGFVDGIALGNEFSWWGMTDKQSKECSSATISSFQKMSDRYLVSLAYSQLKDGLDNFYKDSRNRSILMAGAMWIVVQKINGVPKEKLQQSLEEWRKNAAKR